MGASKSKDKNFSFDDVFWATSNLCELLSYENEMLAQHNGNAISDVAETKAALARMYESAISPLAADPSLTNALAEEQRAELTALALRLKELVEENDRRLRAELETTQALMEAVTAAAKAAAAQCSTYGPDGELDTPIITEPTAKTVDNTI